MRREHLEPAKTVRPTRATSSGLPTGHHVTVTAEHDTVGRGPGIVCHLGGVRGCQCLLPKGHSRFHLWLRTHIVPKAMFPAPTTHTLPCTPAFTAPLTQAPSTQPAKPHRGLPALASIGLRGTQTPYPGVPGSSGQKDMHSSTEHERGRDCLLWGEDGLSGDPRR